MLRFGAIVVLFAGISGLTEAGYQDAYTGDYQKYMDQGADWHSYMDKYAGDYKDKYAGDYKKYLRQGEGKDSGDWHKYLQNSDEYAGKYQKYLHRGEGKPEDWQAYMKKYSGDFQDKYAGDYDKYMSQGEGKQSGDWHKYMQDTDDYAGYYKNFMHASQQGADYQKYVDSHAGDFEQYMDRFRGATMKLAGQPAPMKLSASGNDDDDDEEDTEATEDTEAGEEEEKPEEGNWQYYVKKYAGDYVNIPDNTSDKKAWRDAFIDRYAKAYKHYIVAGERIQAQFPNAPRDAAKCNTLDELKEWRDAQRARIDDFVPKEYQGFAKGSMDEEYKLNKARIQQVTDADAPALAMWSRFSFSADKPPANDATDKEWRDHYMRRYVAAYMPYLQSANGSPHHPEDCHTLDELKSWRSRELKVIDTYVPRSYRAFAAGSVEQEYTDNKARIVKEAGAVAPSEFSAWASSGKALSGQSGASLQPFVLVVAVLPMVGAMVAVVYRSSARTDSDYTEGLLPADARAEAA